MADEMSRDNTDRNFRGQMATEEVLCFCRKHWVVILPYLIGAPLLWILVPVYAFFFNKDPIVNLLGELGYQTFSILFLLGITYLHHRIFFKFLNYFLRILIVTNYRVIELDKTLLFRDSRNTLDVKEIQDIIMKKDGFFRTIFDYGDIDILLSSVTEPRVIRCIPNPEYHFRKINKTKREYIEGRQKAKEVVFSAETERYPENIKTESQVQSILSELRKTG